MTQLINKNTAGQGMNLKGDPTPSDTIAVVVALRFYFHKRLKINIFQKRYFLDVVYFMN